MLFRSPAWLGRDSLCIRATRLPSNARDVNGDGSYISFDAFDWGYADNHSNASEGSKIKLDWAVDDAGNGVELDVVHFVKVSTGVMACFGQTGEVSTEVSGLEVLAASSEVEHVQDDAVSVFMYANILSVTVSSRSTVQLFTVNGALVAQWDGVADVLQTDVNELNAGIYVVKVLSVHGANVKKIIKK